MASRRVRDTLVLALPATATIAALVVVTRRGPYLSPDALAYVGTARNLVDGHGFTPPPGAPPLANFPPLYPLLLAAIGLFGPDPLTVARLANPVIAGLTVLLVGLLVRRVTARTGLALAAQLLVGSGIDVLAIHSSALSEPLFLFFVLLTITALAGDRLVAAALVAGAGCLTRYVGVAVVAAGAVWLVRRRTWKPAAIFTIVALTPLAGWFAWLAVTGERVSNRTAVLHAPDADYVGAGLRSASTWVVPADVDWPWRGLVASVAVVALVAAVRRRPPRRADTTVPLLGLFAVVYMAALVVDRWLFDVTGRLDSRFLLPVHVVAVVVALHALSGWYRGHQAVARVVVWAFVVVHVVVGARWVVDAAGDPDIRPAGFGAPRWVHSTVIGRVRELPPTTPLFTNRVDALYFHTSRVARSIPEEAALLTGRRNPRYEAEVGAMRAALGGGGMLVYFTAPPTRGMFLPPPDRLAASLGLVEVGRDEVGILFRTNAWPTATAYASPQGS